MDTIPSLLSILRCRVVYLDILHTGVDQRGDIHTRLVMATIEKRGLTEAILTHLPGVFLTYSCCRGEHITRFVVEILCTRTICYLFGFLSSNTCL